MEEGKERKVKTEKCKNPSSFVRERGKGKTIIREARRIAVKKMSDTNLPYFK